MKPRRYPAGESPLDIQRCLRERVVRPDKLHLEGVEPRISELPGDPYDFSVSHVEIIFGDLIRDDIKIPVDFLGLLKPEGDLDGHVFLELGEEPRSGVNLFDYQWDLIHCITPFGLSVIAVESFVALWWELVSYRALSFQSLTTSQFLPKAGFANASAARMGSKSACLTRSNTLCVQHFSENLLSWKITSGVAPTRVNTQDLSPHSTA